MVLLANHLLMHSVGVSKMVVRSQDVSPSIIVCWEEFVNFNCFPIFSTYIYLYGIFWGMTFKTMEIMLLYIKKYRKEVVQNVEWFPYANFFPAWSIQSMFLNIARKIDFKTGCSIFVTLIRCWKFAANFILSPIQIFG